MKPGSELPGTHHLARSVRMRRNTATRAFVLAVAVALLATACTSAKKRANSTPSRTASQEGSSTEKATHKQGGTVTISNEQGQTWTCQFNPFNPAVNLESIGFVYEPLVFVNLLNNQTETPMLAKSYSWGPGKKSIVFTVRDGVKWNDGQPFSAADVAFTFNLMKRVPSTDAYALWTAAGLQSVTAGGNQVTMTFDKPAEPYFFNFANQVGIVPEHVFSAGEAAAHPDTWADPDPVGTGPFKVSPCKPNNIQYVANPSYWQAGKPYVQKVEYPAYLDNGPANLDLANGKAQWGSQFIPNIKQFYLSKSGDNHTWSPPVTLVNIFPNLDPSHQATSKLEVRQAIATAIDRNQISAIGEGGQQPPANQAGVVVPTFAKYYDAAAVTAAGYDKPNPDKARQLLATAGYSPAHPLKLSIITITGYTDWDASLAVIKQQLKPIGIDADRAGPGPADLRLEAVHRGLRPGLLRRAGRPHAVLRAAPDAALEELRAARPAGQQQLRAVQQSCPRRAVQRLPQCRRRRPGRDHEAGPGCHAQGHPDHPDDRVRRLVPVQHRRHRRLADGRRSLRAAVGIHRAGRRAGAATPVLAVRAVISAERCGATR